MALRIRFVGGVQDGEAYVILEERGLTIGRSPSNSVYVRDRNVSRMHAQISIQNGVCTITDLQSTNGTFIDEKQVTEAHLEPGMTVRLGTTTFTVEEIETEEPSTGTTELA